MHVMLGRDTRQEAGHDSEYEHEPEVTETEQINLTCERENVELRVDGHPEKVCQSGQSNDGNLNPSPRVQTKTHEQVDNDDRNAGNNSSKFVDAVDILAARVY